MCGIVGIWHFDGKPVREEDLSRFNDSLMHRGPDGSGTWIHPIDGVGFGHRRLAIIDLTDGGKQPMSYADGRYWITYNGELFNFIEIKEELLGLGYQFKSDSDTEVILAAFHQWHEEMLTKFNGMWALAIYDCNEKRMFLSRDRFGIKPFHYTLENNRLAFASELKAFRQLAEFTPKMDREAASHFLQTGQSNEASIRSMMEGVRHLRAGHYAWVKDGKLNETRWWHTMENLPEIPATLDEQAKKYKELFYDAVKLRLRSDVPVASSLSGGFDSSAVVCAIAELVKQQSSSRQTTRWQETFTASFPGTPIDETEDAKKVIEYSGLHGNFIDMKPQEAIAHVDEILFDFDDVSVGLPTPPWFIYKAMRQAGMVVSMDGHGVDETIGGYKQADHVFMHDAPPLWHWQKNLALAKKYFETVRQPDLAAKLPMSEVRKMLLENHPQMGWARELRSNLKTVKDLVKAPPQQIFLAQRDKLSNDFTYFADDDRLPRHWGSLNRELYQMFHSTLLPGILRNFERLSAAHGVEVRMPFMDWRLITYCFALPDSAKLGGGVTKRIAREAMKGHMPESIRSNVFKIGFNPPLPTWFNGPLHPWLMDLVEQFKGHEQVNTSLLKNFIEKNHKQQIWDWPKTALAWRYLHLLWWERRFGS